MSAKSPKEAMKLRKERRFLHTEVRVQKQADKPTIITGYAAVFNSEAKIGSSFSEVIRPGAFNRALKEKQDVRALFNHNDNKVLGRVKPGTLRLAVDDKGLRYEIDAPNTTVANDLIESIDRGDIDASSFGFIARGQKWNETTKDGKTTYLRELTDCDILDVSPVTYPAYSATTTGLRSQLFEGLEIPKEIRAAAADCECDCPECQDDNCAECSDEDCDDENCRCKDRSAHSDTEFRERMEMRLKLAEKL
jgi:HK97 family phage prohead protease